MKEIININQLSAEQYYYMWLWCTENFGIESESCYFLYESDKWIFDEYSDNRLTVIFKNSEDATWFKLRWLDEQKN